jgi:hypothetical protein
MKCNSCGMKNDPKSKFCKECGAELTPVTANQVGKAVSELYGKEVEVLFFFDNFTGRISGIVRPTEEQIHRYQDGILQKIRIEAPGGAKDENVAAILTFIRQSKEYLGEDYNESFYRSFPTSELTKEYLKLFERILKMRIKQDISAKPNPDVKPDNLKHL